MALQRFVPIGFVIPVLGGGSFWGAGAPAEAADISALLTRAVAAENGGNHAAAIEALEQALENVRVEAPLMVKPIFFVTQPAILTASGR